MADYRTPSFTQHTDSHQPRPSQGSMSVGNPAASAAVDGAEAPVENRPKSATNGNATGDAENLAVQASRDGPRAGQAATTISPELQKNVSDVLASEHGVPALLNRLKQSIGSAKEFALFLQKRSILEEDHSRGLKKLCRMTQENMHRPEHREGSFVHAYDEMMVIHDRMAENAAQFAQSLHQMHDDLVELAAYAERNRKGWKNNALAAEQKVADLEAAMRKSKAKYDSLAEEYDRARTGEPRQGGRVLGAFKPKSAAQLEEDLLKKVQMADQTYHGHVLALQGDKSALESSTRPEAVKALQDLSRETDAGLLLQMQKFAAFNEKLLLSNGLIISPVKNANGESSSRSLRQAVMSIDNEKDMTDFVGSHHGMIRPDNGEVKYERHPVLNPQSSHQFNQGPPQQPMQAPQQSMGQFPPQQGQPPQHGQQQSFSMSSRTSTGNFGGPTMGQAPPQAPPGQLDQPPQQQMGVVQPNFPPPGGPQGSPYSAPHNRSVSQGNMMGGPQGGPGGRGAYGQQPQPPQQQQQQMPSQQYAGARHSTQPGGYGPPQGGAPQLGALSFQNSPPPQQQQQQPQAPPPQNAGGAAQHQARASPPPHMVGQQGRMPSPQASNAPPAKPVYGVTLNNLYERDGLAVPMVVYQCMQAVDLFGLGVEGIYRQSGSMAHIQKLKAMFDHDSQNKALDFRNPENFFHDVNSVTGLLKLFFRDLPDPLLTTEHHDAFIAAAKHEDDIVRRDSLHAIINNLPDPNYATLRAISLHLYRVIENSHVNRMNSHNLAVIFGPTLMGSDPSTAIADAGWQIKVIDTILQNTYQIFDED